MGMVKDYEFLEWDLVRITLPTLSLRHTLTNLIFHVLEAGMKMKSGTA